MVNLVLPVGPGHAPEGGKGPREVLNSQLTQTYKGDHLGTNTNFMTNTIERVRRGLSRISHFNVLLKNLLDFSPQLAKNNFVTPTPSLNLGARFEWSVGMVFFSEILLIITFAAEY